MYDIYEEKEAFEWMNGEFVVITIRHSSNTITNDNREKRRQPTFESVTDTVLNVTQSLSLSLYFSFPSMCHCVLLATNFMCAHI